MSPVQPTIEALVDVAHNLVVQAAFDADVALKLLATIPTDDLDVQAVGAIARARLVMLARSLTAAQIATARSALARVVELLECRDRDRGGTAT